MKSSTKDPNSSTNRFYNLFRRLIAKKHNHEIVENLYQRDFDRFPVEFEVSITLIDKNGDEHQDKAELQNISGSGAMFITCIAEKYFLEQTLQLKIFLAGTSDVRACINTEATVVRMQRVKREDGADGPSLMGIAVKFKKTFEFERVDRNHFGETE